MTVVNAEDTKGKRYAEGYKIGEECTKSGEIQYIGDMLADPDVKRGYQDALDAYKHRTQYHAK